MILQSFVKKNSIKNELNQVIRENKRSV